MACSIVRDPRNGQLVEVIAPNGQPSRLFSNALEIVGDPEKALLVWAMAYTPRFKMKYGDWEKDASRLSVDENGEPTVDVVMHTPRGISNIIQTHFSTWKRFQPGVNDFVNEGEALRFKAALKKKFPELDVQLAYSYSMPGKARVVVNPSIKDTSVTFTKKQIEEQKQVVNPIMDRLASKFGDGKKKVTYKWIKPSDLNQEEHYDNVKNIRAFVRDGEIFLVEGRVLPEDGIEELMHVFVEYLRQSRPTLFKGIFDNASTDPKYQAAYVALYTHYRKKYKGNIDLLVQSEFLAKTLATAMKHELEVNPEGRPASTLGKLIQRFLDWLSGILDIKGLTGRETIQEIVQYLNTEDSLIPLPENGYLFYSADPVEPFDFDPESRDDNEQFNERKRKEFASRREQLLDRAKREIEKLENIKKFVEKSALIPGEEAKRIEQIDKLIQNVRDKIVLLEADVETVSVSRYMGSEQIESAKTKVALVGATFGEFFHYLMEELQEDYMKNRKSPSDLFLDPKWFNAFYDKYKDMIQFDNVDRELLRGIGAQIAGLLGVQVAEGKVLLPEIEVAVKDVDGQLVIGRLDIMTLDKSGKINVIDLKTKKTPILTDALSFPRLFFTIRPTASKQVSFKDGVMPIFSQIRFRTALQKYQIQLAIYAEMLIAAGIDPNDVQDRIIYAVAYKVNQPTEDSLVLDNYSVSVFDNEDWAEMDPKGDVNFAAQSRFRAADEMVDTEQTKRQQDTGPFGQMNVNDLTAMVERIKELVATQLAKITEEITAVKNNENISVEERNDQISALLKRKAQITSIATGIEQEDLTGLTPEGVAKSKAMIVAAAIDTFKNEIREIQKKIDEEIDIPETYELKSLQNKNMLKVLQQYASALENIKQYIEAFRNTIASLENIPDSTKRDIQNYLNEVITDTNIGIQKYAAVGKKIMKAIILETIGPGKENGLSKFERVFGDIRKMLTPKLKYLEKTIAELESGQVSVDTLMAKTGRFLSKLISKDKRQSVEILKEEAAKIRKLMEINKLDDTTIDAYLDGLTGNADSVWYIGSTMSGANDGIANIDQLIGQNANSELAISALWQYLRNVTQSAQIEAINWMAETDVNKVTNDFISAMGGDLYAANKEVTEVVEVGVEFDKDNKPTETKQHIQVMDPTSMAYYNTYDAYLYRLRQLDEAIKAKTKEIVESPASERDRLKQEKDEITKDRIALNIEFVNWQIKHSKTKFKAEVMRLMASGGSANQEIADLYRQINSILTDAGGAQNLTDIQQDRIDELESQISRVRQEAIESDPALKEKLDKLLEYFDYDFNTGLWTKKKIEIELNNDAAGIARWHENNSVLSPTQEYLDEVDSIWEQIGTASQEDDVLSALFAKRNAIKNRNKVRGKFNLLYMTQEDIDEYMEIEKQIEDRKELTRDPLGVTNDYIKSLYARLASIQKDELSPVYVKRRDNLIAEVKRAYKEYKAIKDEIDKNQSGATTAMRDRMIEAYNQYVRKEELFAVFFNKYNNTVYELGNDTIAKNADMKEMPKRFVFIKVPSDPSRMELVPNNKYRIKRLKEEAYNREEYQETFVPMRMGGGFYPAPKAVNFNKETNEFVIDPTADQTYVNPKFKAMYADPIKKAFYDKWFIQNYLVKQKLASGRPLGFFAPFVRQRGLENLISKGTEGIKREVKEKIQEIQYGNSKVEAATNESGVTGKQKVFFPENQLVTADLTSTDVIGSIVNWNTGFYTNKTLALSALETEGVLYWARTISSSLSNQKDKQNKIDQIIKEMEYSHMKFNYGQMYEKGASDHPIMNRKTMRVIMQMAAFGRMAFDIPMQFGNMLSGNVQAFLSTQSSRHASYQDYLKAKKTLYTRFLPKMVADYGKQSGLSLETMIYYYMNPSIKDLQGLADMNTVDKMRRLANKVFSFGEIGMVLQDKGEVEIGMTTLLMILHNKQFEQFETNPDGSVIIENGIKKVKLDAEGNTVYVDGTEIFELKNGAIQLREDVNVTEKEMSHIRGTVMTEIYRFQGNYAKATKSRFSGTMLGSLYNFYRNYLIPAVSTRFSAGNFEGVGSAYSWDAPEAYTGYYVALMKMFKYYGWGQAGKALLYDTFLPGFVKKQIDYQPDTDMDYYRGRAAMAAREILMALLFYMLYQALRSLIMDSDDDELNYVELSLVRSLVKVSNESRSMVPLPIIGKPGDYIDNFGQLTSAFKEGKTIWDLAENSFWAMDYAVTGSDFAYQRGFYQRDTDRWMEGDPKLYKNLSDLFAVSNVVDVFKPREAAERAVKMK